MRKYSAANSQFCKVPEAHGGGLDREDARIPEREEGVGSKVPEAHGGGLEREERTELETTTSSKPDGRHFEDTECDLLGEI